MIGRIKQSLIEQLIHKGACTEYFIQYCEQESKMQILVFHY